MQYNKQLALGLVLVLVLMALPTITQAQGPIVTPAENTITVTGQGVAYAAPDIAFISLGVEVSDPDVNIAVNTANENMEAVRAALMSLGVGDNDIRTENFYIYRETIYNEGAPTPDGVFRVSNYLRVTVRNTEQVPQVLSAALEAGANSVNNVVFSVEDTDAIASEARELAVDNARVRAQELADLTEVSVGDVLAIVEGSNAFDPYFANYGYGGGGGGAGAPPIEGGSLAIQVIVQVTFELVR